MLNSAKVEDEDEDDKEDDEAEEETEDGGKKDWLLSAQRRASKGGGGHSLKFYILYFCVIYFAIPLKFFLCWHLFLNMPHLFYIVSQFLFFD